MTFGAEDSGFAFARATSIARSPPAITAYSPRSPGWRTPRYASGRIRSSSGREPRHPRPEIRERSVVDREGQRTVRFALSNDNYFYEFERWLTRDDLAHRGAALAIEMS